MTRPKKGGDGFDYEIRAPRQGRFSVQRGPKVEIDYDLVALEWIDFTAKLEQVEPVISGHLLLDDPPSRYVLDSFCLHRSEASTLDTGSMRSVPLDFLVTVVCRNFGLAGLEHPDGVLEEDGSVEVPDVYEGLELRKRGMSDEEALRFVARTYLHFSLLAHPPVGWVAAMLDCSLPTANRWVAAAKNGGYLRVARTMR